MHIFWVSCFHPLPFWLALHLFLFHFFLLLLFSRLVVSDFLWPHGLQYARLPCPSLSPGACSNVCPLSGWCHPTISSSVVPFSSRIQSFPASGSFLMSQFFPSGGQSFGASTSAFKILVSYCLAETAPKSLFLRAWHWCYSKSILRTLKFLKTKDAFLHLYFFSNDPIVYGVCVCAQLLQSCLTLWDPHGLYPARLLHLWDFPGKNTEVGCHTLLQGIFLTQGSSLCLLHLLHAGRFFTAWTVSKVPA